MPAPLDKNHPRSRARALGRKRYFDPTPCSKGGHIAERFTSSGRCCLCHAEEVKEKAAYHREKSREFRARHPEYQRARKAKRAAEKQARRAKLLATV